MLFFNHIFGKLAWVGLATPKPLSHPPTHPITHPPTLAQA